MSNPPASRSQGRIPLNFIAPAEGTRGQVKESWAHSAPKMQHNHLSYMEVMKSQVLCDVISVLVRMQGESSLSGVKRTMHRSAPLGGSS